MSSINEVISGRKKGMFYRNRLILPFQCYFLKVIINDDIITDFSPSAKGIYIHEESDFTDVYFHDYKDLKDALSKHEPVKMIVVEKNKDIFNFENHLKLVVYLEESHSVRIEIPDSNIIFIE